MGTPTRVILNILVVVLALGGGLYQVYIRPMLATFGTSPFRIPESIGNKQCKAIPELKACQKIVLHKSTGVLYLACSTPESRTNWMPSFNRFNATDASFNDYIATYDPATSKITKWSYSDFNKGRGLSLAGMDVVPSSSNPRELFVYFVNHRVPITGQWPDKIGADSVIEIFKTTSGGDFLTHIKTVEHPIIVTPSDVLGSADGKSFYFTNDHATKIGFSRYLDLIGVKSGSVGYCHTDEGCKFAITKTHASYGIAGAPNGTIYVSDSVYGGVTVLERQVDNTLVVADTIKTDYTLNNMAVDADGHLWAAALPQTLTACHHMERLDRLSPSAAKRITINTGVNAFYGEKYKIEKAFEDDGNIMTGATSVAYDSRRKRLFLHGTSASHLSVCTL